MDESVIKHLEQPQQVGTLKLSEAIRIGARIRPQIRRDYFDGVGSCAIGAAFEAVTGRMELGYPCGRYLKHSLASLQLEERWRIVDQVIQKNDGGMTREAIADWLEAQGL